MSLAPRRLLVSAPIALIVASSLTPLRQGHGQQRLAPRQLWSIKSPTPTTSKVIVGRIETRSGKGIIHVSIIDIPKPGSERDGETLSIGHVPFDQLAFVNSIDRLLARDVPPSFDFESGYEEWRANAHASVFETDVSQTIAVFLEMITRRRT
jgi:hypothetical protein